MDINNSKYGNDSKIVDPVLSHERITFYIVLKIMNKVVR
jgi:hypothetical protein